MLARSAAGELAHQRRHLGIAAHLERFERVDRLGPEVQHQLFHG
jgi:hypothetical protein